MLVGKNDGHLHLSRNGKIYVWTAGPCTMRESRRHQILRLSLDGLALAGWLLLIGLILGFIPSSFIILGGF